MPLDVDRRPKLLYYLSDCQLLNSFGSSRSAPELLADMHLIVCHFASDADQCPELWAQLRRLYEAVCDQKGPRAVRLRIVHVPIDVDVERAWHSFVAHCGPWCSLKPGSEQIGELVRLYRVIGTPQVDVIRPNGEVVSFVGVDDLAEFGANVLSVWSS